MNALRLTDGFDLNLFSERTGLPPENLDGFINRATQLDFIELNQGHLSPSARGMDFLNDMLLLL